MAPRPKKWRFLNQPSALVPRKRPKKAPSEPRVGGILVKDYFPIVGSFIAIVGVAVTIGVGWMNTQRQLGATALASEQKLLNDQFIDVQNRLSKIDNASERVNAVNSLVDIAIKPDPAYRGAVDDRELAKQLELPVAWTGKLYVRSTIRPCEKAYPYFKPVALRVASVLLLDKDQVVRDAAARACERLSQFSRSEIEGLTWKDFDHIQNNGSAIPLTKFLVENLAQVNRDAHAQWFAEFARFIGVAQALGDVYTGSYQSRDIHYEWDSWPSQISGDRSSRRLRLLPLPSRAQTKKARYWTNPDGIWDLLHALCPFVRDADLNLDFILSGTEDAEFTNEVVAKRQVMGNTNRANWSAIWIQQQESIRSASARLISTAKGLAFSLTAGRLLSNQLPAKVPDAYNHAHTAESARQWQRDWQDGGDRPLMKQRFGLDLHACVLPSADLYKAQFPAADLHDAMFPDADVQMAYFPGADLRNARFQDARLSAATFPGVDLTGAEFAKANLFEASFVGSDLSRAQFPLAVLQRSKFGGSVLDRAAFPGAFLDGSELQGANLTDTKFGGADFEGARFDEANFHRAEFANARFSQDAIKWIAGDATTNPETECILLDKKGKDLLRKPRPGEIVNSVEAKPSP